MIDLTTPIIPYVGTGIFKLDSSYNEIKSLLAEHDIPYDEEISQPNDIDPPWYIIGIAKDGSEFDSIELFFVRNRLFKICLCNDFSGTLPNGIHVGMNFREAEKIDPNLQQDEEWDEVFISSDGYLIEYSNTTLDLVCISVFIPALLRDDFYEYKW